MGPDLYVRETGPVWGKKKKLRYLCSLYSLTMSDRPSEILGAESPIYLLNWIVLRISLKFQYKKRVF